MLVLGCAPKPTQSYVAPDQNPCLLVANPATPLDTVTVALLDPVSRDHFLAPVTDSELLLYRMTFDTPLRLDCRGRVLPGLAEAWDKDATGRTWTLTLKDDVRRYHPDSSMTAHDVVGAWSERKAVEGSMALESAVALDDRRISITLIAPQDSVPRVLADPSFSLVISAAQRPRGVRFKSEEGGDPRDALDRGADLAITRDPAILEYVARRPEFRAFALPWSRTYAMLQPASAEPLELTRGDADRGSLARDVVRADARAAEPPFWWTEVSTCPAGLTSRSTPVSSRVVYIQGDEVARGLAERFVALAGSGTHLRAAALKPADFAAQLRTGADRAYVVALPRQTLAPCRQSTAWPAGARIEPLIDTRAHAIVRGGAPPLTVDWDGTVRVAPR